MFENIFFSEHESVLKAIQDARSWKSAQATTLKSSLPQCVGYSSPSSCVLAANPFTGSCYSDAAWDSSSGNYGIGWHLHDPTNSVTEKSSSQRCFVSSSLLAEALAVKAALVAAVSFQVSNIIMYSDSKNLITFLKSQGQDVVLKGVLHDISMLAHSFTSISFVHIPRLANVQADSLDKAALFLISALNSSVV